MPLWENKKAGEREHTALDSRRDKQLRASDAWTLVDEGEETAADDTDDAPAAEPLPRRAPRMTKPPAPETNTEG